MFTKLLKRNCSNFVKATLPALDYDYGDLEPILSAKLMKIHHGKHHQTYVNNYNNLVEKFLDAEASGDLELMATLMKGLAFNAGGHFNHSFFWENLAPRSREGGSIPDETSEFTKAVIDCFGSFDNLKERFTAKTIAVQGSGWGWIAFDPITKKLSLSDTPNQEFLKAKGLTPLMSNINFF